MTTPTMNFAPQLVFALAANWARRKEPDLSDYDLDRGKLVLYDPPGEPFFFAHAHGPSRWYYQATAYAEHYTRAEIEDVEAASRREGFVQFLGDRGKPIGTWRNWDLFWRAVNEIDQ